MALDVVKNFAVGELSIGVDNVATSLTLKSGHGARFPQTGAFNVVVYNSSDYPDSAEAYWQGEAEIMRVTSIAGDTLTVERAQEGTSAVNHNTAGKTYKVLLALTEKMITDISQLNEEETIPMTGVVLAEDLNKGDFVCIDENGQARLAFTKVDIYNGNYKPGVISSNNTGEVRKLKDGVYVAWTINNVNLYFLHYDVNTGAYISTNTVSAALSGTSAYSGQFAVAKVEGAVDTYLCVYGNAGANYLFEFTYDGSNFTKVGSEINFNAYLNKDDTYCRIIHFKNDMYFVIAGNYIRLYKRNSAGSFAELWSDIGEIKAFDLYGNLAAYIVVNGTNHYIALRQFNDAGRVLITGGSSPQAPDPGTPEKCYIKLLKDGGMHLVVNGFLQTATYNPDTLAVTYTYSTSKSLAYSNKRTVPLIFTLSEDYLMTTRSILYIYKNSNGQEIENLNYFPNGYMICGEYNEDTKVFEAVFSTSLTAVENLYTVKLRLYYKLDGRMEESGLTGETKQMAEISKGAISTAEDGLQIGKYYGVTGQNSIGVDATPTIGLAIDVNKLKLMKKQIDTTNITLPIKL